MTVDQKIDLIEARPIQGARHMIPSGRMRFVVESSERGFLPWLERWAVRVMASIEAQKEAEIKYYMDSQ